MAGAHESGAGNNEINSRFIANTEAQEHEQVQRETQEEESSLENEMTTEQLMQSVGNISDKFQSTQITREQAHEDYSAILRTLIAHSEKLDKSSPEYEAAQITQRMALQGAAMTVSDDPEEVLQALDMAKATNDFQEAADMLAKTRGAKQSTPPSEKQYETIPQTEEAKELPQQEKTENPEALSPQEAILLQYESAIRMKIMTNITNTFSEENPIDTNEIQETIRFMEEQLRTYNEENPESKMDFEARKASVLQEVLSSPEMAPIVTDYKQAIARSQRLEELIQVKEKFSYEGVNMSTLTDNTPDSVDELKALQEEAYETMSKTDRVLPIELQQKLMLSTFREGLLTEDSLTSLRAAHTEAKDDPEALKTLLDKVADFNYVEKDELTKRDINSSYGYLERGNLEYAWNKAGHALYGLEAIFKTKSEQIVAQNN